LLVPITVGLLTLIAYGDDEDFPLSWVAALLVLLGRAAGSLVRFFADELRRKRDSLRSR
jgi:hypothetical protein